MDNKNQNTEQPVLSVIIPCYNEEEGIASVLETVKQEKDPAWEIIVVNDGSTDNTYNILEEFSAKNNDPSFRIIHQKINRGYGASLKYGSRIAAAPAVAFFDADGQHRISDLKMLFDEFENFGYDMVVGARQGIASGTLMRQPGKKIISWFVNYLTARKIPDINSGLRIVRKDIILSFLPILPNGFSLTTTITVATSRMGYNLSYLPIEPKKRVGKSVVSWKDGYRTIKTLVRIGLLFSALRLFFPFIIFFALLTTASFINDIFILGNVADVSIILFLTTCLTGILSLLTEQIAQLRLQIGFHNTNEFRKK